MVEAVHIARTHPGNVTAQDLALQCYASGLARKLDVSLCERSLQIDPRNALAMGGMAMNSVGPILGAQRPKTDTQEAIRRADEWLTKAIAADPNLYLLHEVKAWVLILQKRPKEAVVAAERGLAVNPSFVGAYFPMCVCDRSIGPPGKERGAR
jgi:hypothetical protein